MLKQFIQRARVVTIDPYTYTCAGSVIEVEVGPDEQVKNQIIGHLIKKGEIEPYDPPKPKVGRPRGSGYKPRP